MDLDLRFISRSINEWMWHNQRTLSTAESCTAGRLGSVITAVPGSSSYYEGGIICYSDKVKIDILGVNAALIEEKTAVCEEVVRQMVEGALKLFGTDYAIATSGFAGPGGAKASSAEVGVGTIWLAVGSQDKVQTYKLEEDYGRDKNLSIATAKAIRMLIEFLDEEKK